MSAYVGSQLQVECLNNREKAVVLDGCNVNGTRSSSPSIKITEVRSILFFSNILLMLLIKMDCPSTIALHQFRNCIKL